MESVMNQSWCFQSLIEKKSWMRWRDGEEICGNDEKKCLQLLDDSTGKGLLGHQVCFLETGIILPHLR